MESYFTSQNFFQTFFNVSIFLLQITVSKLTRKHILEWQIFFTSSTFFFFDFSPFPHSFLLLVWFYYARVLPHWQILYTWWRALGVDHMFTVFPFWIIDFPHQFFSFNQSAFTNCRRFPKQRCISRSCNYKQKLISIFISIKTVSYFYDYIFCSFSIIFFQPPTDDITKNMVSFKRI